TNINFTVTASITAGGGTPTNQTVLSGGTVANFVERSQAGGVVLDGDQFYIDVPSGTSELKVSFQGDVGSEIGLIGKYGSRVALSPAGIDFFSDLSGERGSITINPLSSPRLQAGRYFFAVANLSVRGVSYQLTFATSTSQSSERIQRLI